MGRCCQNAHKENSVAVVAQPRHRDQNCNHEYFIVRPGIVVSTIPQGGMNEKYTNCAKQEAHPSPPAEPAELIEQSCVA